MRRPLTVRTAIPDPPAPRLRCPDCNRWLEYLYTVLGGVASHSERWDQYCCRQCGSFEYRQRTRRLRAVPALRLSTHE